MVAVTGPQGAGKTQRLLLAAAEAREHHALPVYLDVATQSDWAYRDLVAAFDKAARNAGLVKRLGTPGWLRNLSAISKAKAGAHDPKDAGRRIGEALNATIPSFLLLNDLQNLAEASAIEALGKTLEEVSGVIKPGVLVMFGCYASYLAWLTATQPAFASRINRTIPLAAFTDDEARLVLAKKLLAKRIVEELEPTYPFDREAVQELNRAARGNPRRLFELADAALEHGVATRAYQIDADAVRTVLAARGRAPASDPDEARPQADPSEPSPEASPPSVRAAPGPRRSLWGRSR